MFDRRFDEQEEETPLVQDDVSEQSFEGVPSISDLLNTLQNTDIETLLQDEIQKIEEESGEISEEKEEEKEEEGEAETSEEKQEESPSQEAFSHEEKENLEKELLEITAKIKALEEENLRLKEELKTKENSLMPEEVETAKQASFLDGKEKGMQEAKEATWQEALASIEKQNSDLLERIDASLKEMLAESEQLSAKAFEHSVTLSKALSRRILPALSEKNALEEIEHLLEKSFQFLKEEPKISLRINPFLADKIKPLVANIVKKEAYIGKVAVLRDDTIALGDCRVEWKNGGAERNIEEVLTQAEALMTAYLQTNSSSDEE